MCCGLTACEPLQSAAGCVSRAAHGGSPRGTIWALSTMNHESGVGVMGARGTCWSRRCSLQPHPPGCRQDLNPARASPPGSGAVKLGTFWVGEANRLTGQSDCTGVPAVVTARQVMAITAVTATTAVTAIMALAGSARPVMAAITAIPPAWRQLLSWRSRRGWR
jgi:hypothetical protein